jgi:hypothetical protein
MGDYASDLVRANGSDRSCVNRRDMRLMDKLLKYPIDEVRVIVLMTDFLLLSEQMHTGAPPWS